MAKYENTGISIDIEKPSNIVKNTGQMAARSWVGNTPNADDFAKLMNCMEIDWGNITWDGNIYDISDYVSDNGVGLKNIKTSLDVIKLLFWCYSKLSRESATLEFTLQFTDSADPVEPASQHGYNQDSPTWKNAWYLPSGKKIAITASLDEATMAHVSPETISWKWSQSNIYQYGPLTNDDTVVGSEEIIDYDSATCYSYIKNMSPIQGTIELVSTEIDGSQARITIQYKSGAQNYMCKYTAYCEYQDSGITRSVSNSIKMAAPGTDGVHFYKNAGEWSFISTQQSSITIESETNGNSITYIISNTSSTASNGFNIEFGNTHSKNTLSQYVDSLPGRTKETFDVNLEKASKYELEYEEESTINVTTIKRSTNTPIPCSRVRLYYCNENGEQVECTSENIEQIKETFGYYVTYDTQNNYDFIFTIHNTNETSNDITLYNGKIPGTEYYNIKATFVPQDSLTYDIITRSLISSAGENIVLKHKQTAPAGIYYFYVGTTKPTSLQYTGVTTVSSYQTEQTFTNPSTTEKCYVYVLTNSNKTVNMYDPADPSDALLKAEDTSTISGYKITYLSADGSTPFKIAKGGSIIIRIS